MKRVLLVGVLILASLGTAQPQSNIITTSLNGFSYGDNTSFKFSSTPEMPFFLNLSYERLVGDYGIKLKFGGYDLVYEARNKGEIGRRQFALLSLGAKRYFKLTDFLYCYPSAHLTFRLGEGEWYLERDHWGEVFVDAIYSDIGLAAGGGLQFELFDLIILEPEVKYTRFFHNEDGDSDLLQDEAFDDVGSEQQFSLVLSAGVLF